MKRFLILISIVLVSCQTVVQDRAKPTIETNQQRVETVICDKHAVGLNGCLFKDGVVDSRLKIFNISKGSIRVLGCGLDLTSRYDLKNGEWFDVELPERIENDCMISIYQQAEWPKQDKFEFPVKGFIGSVFLGRCLSGQSCQYSDKQIRRGDSLEIVEDLEDIGAYKLIGCGKELAMGDYNGQLELDLGKLVENKGCVFYVLIKGQKTLYKHIIYVNVMELESLNLALPSVVKKKFQSDGSVLGYIQDGKIKMEQSGKAEGLVRFYSSAGRSLLVQFKDGGIEWSK